MQKQDDNIIKFESQKSQWSEDEDFGGEISEFVKTILFKNANLVDIENDSVKLVDILVENGEIKKIAKGIRSKKDATIVDLHKSFVLPAFMNGCGGMDGIVGIDIGQSEKNKMLMRELMATKDVSAGVVSFNDVKSGILLEHVDELDEKDLSEISDFSAKNDLQIILKVGRDLEELGSVDKKFGKSLPLVLEDFGILDRNWVLVGGNCLEKDDLRIFREHGDKFVVCPGEDAQAGRRPTNLVTLKNLDFDVRIGSGRAFEIDFFAYMRQILMAHWGLFEDTSCLTEKDVMLMSTNAIPTLVEGMPADFIVVSGGQSLYPTVLKSLVWGKSKQDVLMTLFEGRPLQEFGDVCCLSDGLDQEELIEEIIKARKREKKDEN